MPSGSYGPAGYLQPAASAYPQPQRQPDTLPATAPTTTQGASNTITYAQPQVAAPSGSNQAYAQLIQSIQASQERDNRAIREMIEGRQATAAVVKALQSSDASTVEMFEKMLLQMKNNPAQPTSAQPSTTQPTSSRPAPPLVTIPGTSQAPVTNGNVALNDMQKLLNELKSTTTVVTSAGSVGK